MKRGVPSDSTIAHWSASTSYLRTVRASENTGKWPRRRKGPSILCAQRRRRRVCPTADATDPATAGQRPEQGGPTAPFHRAVSHREAVPPTQDVELSRPHSTRSAVTSAAHRTPLPRAVTRSPRPMPDVSSRHTRRTSVITNTAARLLRPPSFASGSVEGANDAGAHSSGADRCRVQTRRSVHVERSEWQPAILQRVELLAAVLRLRSAHALG